MSARRTKIPKKGPGSRKVAITFGEFKKKTLRSSSGKRVTDPKQAFAIGASKARKAKKEASSRATKRGARRRRR